MNSPLFRKKNSKNDKNITALVGNFSPPSSVDHQREIVGGSRSPSVSSPTHTPLSSPNFKSKDRNINKSLITEVALNQPINHILPKTVCKLLNSAIIIINLWGSSEKEYLLIGMGVATIFSFVFGYLIIMSLNVGLAYEISRKRQRPEDIGIFYQRALLINLLFSACVITPALYLSRRLMWGVPTAQERAVGEYLYQLVPSIYCFAFYDTTQTYLQAQGHILAPLVIQVVAVFMHLLLIKKLGAAWSKNATDCFSAIAIYTYIVSLPVPLPSWIEWTIKCVKGWGFHMKFLYRIGLATYLQALFIFFFSLMAYNLPQYYMTCHICYINLYQLLFLLFMGIKYGALSKVGFYVKHSHYRDFHREGIRTIRICIATSIFLIIMILLYQDDISCFFLRETRAQEIFKNNLGYICTTIFLDSIFIGLSALLKALSRNFAILKLSSGFYLGSLAAAYYLSFSLYLQLKGLWIGWICGISFNIICFIFTLRNKYYELQQEERQRESYRDNQLN